MSYNKMMKRTRNAKRYKPQPMLFSTGSGFWPSGAFLKNQYWPYLEKCKKIGVEPLSCEKFYKIGDSRNV